MATRRYQVTAYVMALTSGVLGECTMMSTNVKTTSGSAATSYSSTSSQAVSQSAGTDETGAPMAGTEKGTAATTSSVPSGE